LTKWKKYAILIYRFWKRAVHYNNAKKSAKQKNKRQEGKKMKEEKQYMKIAIGIGMAIMIIAGWIFKFYPNPAVAEAAIGFILIGGVLTGCSAIIFSILLGLEVINSIHWRISRQFPRWWCYQLGLGITLVAIPLLAPAPEGMWEIFCLGILCLGGAVVVSAGRIGWLTKTRQRAKEFLASR